MIGKLIEIHPNDAFSTNPELLGTLWGISDMRIWKPETSFNPGVVGYYYGSATKIEADDYPFEYGYFHAVKFEIIENTGE